MMENKLVIPLGEYKIVAEICDKSFPFPPEMIICIYDKANNIVQDVCLVRPHFEYSRKQQEFVTNDNFVDCIVWADSDDEDYTDKHVIGIHEEEEE